MDTGEPDGRLIDGRFRLLERLGGGGMGLVWRARDTALHRDVALKEVRPPDPALLAADPAAAHELRERVLREARALARLQHPNVVTIHHIVDQPDLAHPWLVMELVTGGSLADRIAERPLTPAEAARTGRGVLAALRAAHAAGIQHRDVKPGNILLRPDGSPVLTDFGIAAVQEATSLTATGALIGSPEYIAPERIRGTEGDPASDLWSLAMTLYVAVEGHHPLRRATSYATLAAVLDEPLPPATRAGALGPVLTAALARNPAERPGPEQLDQLLAAAETTTTAGYSATHLDTPHPFPHAHTAGSATAAPYATAGAAPYGSTAGPYAATASPYASTAATADPPVRRRRTGALVAAAVVLAAVAGSLAWTLRPHAKAQGGLAQQPTASSTHRPATTTPGAVPATQTPSATLAVKRDLLTPDGVRTAIDALRPLMNGTSVSELVVYPEYANAKAPIAPGSRQYDTFQYRDGKATKQAHGGSGTFSPSEKIVDLTVYDWTVLPALIQKAQDTLNVPHPTSRYLIIDTDRFSNGPTIRVYLADEYGGGYLSADVSGKVLKTFPRA